MSREVKPFRIAVGDDVLDDLKSRLRKTRWPEAEPVDDWSQGVPLAGSRRSAATGPTTTTGAHARSAAQPLRRSSPREIDGLDIHFLHVRSPHADALPLVITHGWPGSIVEFHKVIEPLTDPDEVRRRCRRRLPRGLPVAAGLRLLGQAHDHRLGHRSHRRRLGRADGSPRLRPLRRAGRRLGLGGDHGARRAGPAALRRHPHHPGHAARPQVGGEPTPEEAAGAQGRRSTTPTGTPATPSSNRPGRRPWATA